MKYQWIVGMAFLVLLILGLVIMRRSSDAPLEQTPLLTKTTTQPVDAVPVSPPKAVSDDEQVRNRKLEIAQEGSKSLVKPKAPQVAQVNPGAEVRTGKGTIADVLKTPPVISAQESMLKIAKRQAQADYTLVQNLIEQVSTPDRLSRVGWEVIDYKAVMLSTDTLDAYHRWRATIIISTPPKYSVKEVKGMTSAKPEFLTSSALTAKTRLLNTAEQMGKTDRVILKSVVKNIEEKEEGWATGDLLMNEVHDETRNAYREWKAAVLSAP